MLNEYAIEPDCMGDWETFRFLTSGIGISSGRLIARFPKKWLKKVNSICMRNFKSFRQKQLLAEELQRIKKFGLIDKKRDYDFSFDWLTNALQQYRLDPFKAIIVSDRDGPGEYVLKAREITGSTPCWNIDTDMAVDRTVEGLCCAAKTLLEISDEIVFVDRIFDPAEIRWKMPLKRFIEIATNSRTYAPEMHFVFTIRDEELIIARKQVNFNDYCIHHLSEILPDGVSMNFCRIDQKPEGEGIHARYILTDKGGMRIDWGLDIGRAGQTTDVGILGNTLWKKRWNDFCPRKNQTFSIVEQYKVFGRQR